MAAIKQSLMDRNMDVMAVENCGMEGEKTYVSADEIPDDAGYFTVILTVGSEDR